MKLLEILVLLGLVLFLFVTHKDGNRRKTTHHHRTEKRPVLPLNKSKDVMVFHEQNLKYVSRPSQSRVEDSEEKYFWPVIENERDAEIYDHLTIMKGDRGNYIFHKYKDEKTTHESQLNNNLTLTLNKLSALNGESGMGPEQFGDEEAPTDTDPMKLEEAHDQRVKTILGDHYEYVSEREKNEDFEN